MLSPLCTVQEADDYVLRTFPEGSKITIIEPFYKIAADGIRSIRVDDPADVIFSPPSSSQPHAGVGHSDQEGGLGASIDNSKKMLKEGTLHCRVSMHVCHMWCFLSGRQLLVDRVMIFWVYISWVCSTNCALKRGHKNGTVASYRIETFWVHVQAMRPWQWTPFSLHCKPQMQEWSSL